VVFESLSVPETYDRKTVGAIYDGVVDVAAVGHTLHVRGLENDERRASEMKVGGHARVGELVGFEASAGYVVADDGKLRGKARVEVGHENGLRAEVGYERAPLFLTTPLTKDDELVMRDAIWAGAGYGRILEVHAQLEKEDDYSAHERHELLARIPILGDADEGTPRVEVRIPVAIERQPRPSPLYESDARTLSLGLGVELTQDVAQSWGLGVVVDYAAETAETRDKPSETERHARLDARFDLRLRPAASLELTFGADVQRADDPAYETAHDLPRAFRLGVAYVR
jgi:hypothetical protein